MCPCVANVSPDAKSRQGEGQEFGNENANGVLALMVMGLAGSSTVSQVYAVRMPKAIHRILRIGLANRQKPGTGHPPTATTWKLHPTICF